MQSASQVRLMWPNRAPRNSAPAARLELVEPGHPGAMLVEGDNFCAMSALARRSPAAFAMVYMDPPFYTGKVHHRVKRERSSKAGKVVRTLHKAFDDRWDSLHDYLTALAERVAVARELLTADGCLVLHVDPKTSHYAKILCDEVFGAECFASEIVWRYRRWPAKTPNFQRVHDVLLRYVRDAEQRPRFNQLYEPLAASTLATWGTSKQRAVVKNGRRARSSSTDEPTPGAPLGDVWEIGIVAPVSRERTGYPTQKPEALLERLVQSCTRQGDLILDPYAGSGTTLAVSHRLGRRAVGIDSSPEALEVTRERLRALGVAPLEERVVAIAPAPARAPRVVPEAAAS